MLLDVLQAIRERTDSVIVAVSRGKDSLAVLDLACKTFRRVEAYHMHLVPGLSFVESFLEYLERRYGIKIERRPHWALSRLIRAGTYRFLTRSCPSLKERDISKAERARTGLEWIVSGEKASDTLMRRMWLSAFKREGHDGVNDKAKLAYPLARWTDRQVFAYLKQHKIPLPADYAVFGRSWSTDLDGKSMAAMRERFPDDYAKIEEVFPLVGAAIARERIAGRRAVAASQAAGVCDRSGREEPNQPGALQPADD